MAGKPIVKAVGELVSVLDELGVSYYALCTQDVDLVADLKPEQAELPASRLNTAFYADAGQMLDALRYGRSFNVIHFATGFKIDIFPLGKDSFHAGELARSERRVWEVDSAARIELRVSSAEDTILEKLIRYKRGGQVADRQWSDVLGVATTRPPDREYLREWAPRLGVVD